MKCISHMRSLAFFSSACIVLSLSAATARALDLGVSANVGGISADVGASANSGGLNTKANASVGGAKGVNADVGADVGGRDGVNANVDLGAGGSRSLNAKVNARALDSSGTGANVDVRLSGEDATSSTLFGPNGLNLGPGGGADEVGDGAGSVAGASSSSSAVVERFRTMPVNDRRKMLIRCRDISVSGGYDPELAGLCGLLRSAASR
jgi:hypothetical protein